MSLEADRPRQLSPDEQEIVEKLQAERAEAERLATDHMLGAKLLELVANGYAYSPGIEAAADNLFALIGVDTEMPIDEARLRAAAETLWEDCGQELGRSEQLGISVKEIVDGGVPKV